MFIHSVTYSCIEEAGEPNSQFTATKPLTPSYSQAEEEEEDEMVVPKLQRL